MTRTSSSDITSSSPLHTHTHPKNSTTPVLKTNKKKTTTTTETETKDKNVCARHNTYDAMEKNEWQRGKERKWTIERVCAINIKCDISALNTYCSRYSVEHICASGKYIFTFVSLLQPMCGWERERERELFILFFLHLSRVLVNP